MQKNSQCLLKAGSYTQHVVVICYPNRVSSMLHVCCLLIMLVWMQWYIGSNRLTTTAEMRDKCSPRWIVYHKRHSQGAQKLGGVTTQQECLKRCADNPNCIAVDWNTPPDNAGYMTPRTATTVLTIIVATSRNLKSSEDVKLHQV